MRALAAERFIQGTLSLNRTNFRYILKPTLRNRHANHTSILSSSAPSTRMGEMWSVCDDGPKTVSCASERHT